MIITARTIKKSLRCTRSPSNPRMEGNGYCPGLSVLIPYMSFHGGEGDFIELVDLSEGIPGEHLADEDTSRQDTAQRSGSIVLPPNAASMPSRMLLRSVGERVQAISKYNNESRLSSERISSDKKELFLFLETNHRGESACMESRKINSTNYEQLLSQEHFHPTTCGRQFFVCRTFFSSLTSSSSFIRASIYFQERLNISVVLAGRWIRCDLLHPPSSELTGSY